MANRLPDIKCIWVFWYYLTIYMSMDDIQRVAPYPDPQPEYGRRECVIPGYLPEHGKASAPYAIPEYPVPTSGVKLLG